MTDFSAYEVWSLSDKKLASLLDSDVLSSKSRKITFYNPSFAYHKLSPSCSSDARFPTISVTGAACALNCKHCGGKVLKTMLPADTPEQLFGVAKRLKGEGAVGCLVSGGCLPNGSVPLKRFVPSFARMKRELGFTVIVHTGFIGLATAEALKQAGVDAAIGAVHPDADREGPARRREADGARQRERPIRAIHDIRHHHCKCASGGSVGDNTGRDH